MKIKAGIHSYLIAGACLLPLCVNAATPVFSSGTPTGAGNPFSIPPPETYGGSVTGSDLKYHAITIELAGAQTQTFSAPILGTIFGLAVTGEVGFFNSSSSAKIILIDQNTSTEYQVYEGYPSIGDKLQFSLSASCEETCWLSGITQFSLRMELTNAYLRIDQLAYANSPRGGTPTAIQTSQNDAAINALNASSQRWKAGNTAVSRMTYEQKKALFFNHKVADLRGLDYYVGGIFDVTDAQQHAPLPAATDSLVKSFDWRLRHGRNWMTEVKQQSCYDCWAFAAVGAVEAAVNTYYNRPVNIDLSEQELVSCGNHGLDCKTNGGNTGVGLEYVRDNGLTTESCLTYTGPDTSCAVCNDPTNVVKIGGIQEYASQQYPVSESSLKKMLIDFGPIATGIASMGHAMVLVGYTTDSEDGRTIWIFKNSWGKEWGGELAPWFSQIDQSSGGNKGYAYIKTPLENIFYNYYLSVAAMEPTLETPIEILCEDRDADQYCNWGTSPERPSTCPASCRAEKDCDDSNSVLGPFDGNFHCTATPGKVTKYITLWNTGSASLVVSSLKPRSSAPWIAVTPASFTVQPNESQLMEVTVDYDQYRLANGNTVTKTIFDLLLGAGQNPYPDGIEVRVGEILGDSDGDGFSDLSELAYGTDPHNAGSYPGSWIDLDDDGIPHPFDPVPTAPATGMCEEVAGDVGIAYMTYVGIHTCNATGRISTGHAVRVGGDAGVGDVQFVAGQGIRLFPGFSVTRGSRFRAGITP